MQTFFQDRSFLATLEHWKYVFAEIIDERKSLDKVIITFFHCIEKLTHIEKGECCQQSLLFLPIAKLNKTGPSKVGASAKA